MYHDITTMPDTEKWYFDAHLDGTSDHKSSLAGSWLKYWTSFTHVDTNQLTCPCVNTEYKNHKDARVKDGAHVRLKTCVVLDCEEFQNHGHCDHRMKYAYAILPVCKQCNTSTNPVIKECVAVPFADPSMQMYIGYYKDKKQSSDTTHTGMNELFELHEMSLTPSAIPNALPLASLTDIEVIHILDQRYLKATTSHKSLKKFLIDQIVRLDTKFSPDLTRHLTPLLDTLRNGSDRETRLSAIVAKQDAGPEVVQEILREILVRHQGHRGKNTDLVKLVKKGGKPLDNYDLSQPELLFIGSQRCPSKFPEDENNTNKIKVSEVVERFRTSIKGVSNGGFDFKGVNASTGVAEKKVGWKVDSDKHHFLKKLVSCYQRIIDHEDPVWKAVCKPIKVLLPPMKPTAAVLPPIPAKVAGDVKSKDETEIQVELHGTPVPTAQFVDKVTKHELMLLAKRAEEASVAVGVAMAAATAATAAVVAATLRNL